MTHPCPYCGVPVEEGMFRKKYCCYMHGTRCNELRHMRTNTFAIYKLSEEEKQIRERLLKDAKENKCKSRT